LTTRDASELARARTPEWHRRLASWAIFVIGLVFLVVLVNIGPTTACSEASPCRPDPLSAIGGGLAISACFLAFVLSWASGVAAAAAAVTAAWFDALHPDQAFPAGTAGLIGLAAITFALAWFAERDPGGAAVREWAHRVGLVSAPPAAVPRVGRIARVTGVLLILAAAGCAWYGVERQRHADAQQRAASVESARVDKHIDEFTLRLTRADGRAATIAVADAADYPVGQQIRLAVDAHGLMQPLAEPYDATGWHLLAAMSAAFGLASLVRGLRSEARLRALVRDPQPASSVLLSGDHLFAGDAGSGDLAFARLNPRGPVLSPPRPYEVDEDDDEEDAMTAPPMPVTLYGSPVVGSDVLLVYDDVVLRARLKPPAMHGVLAGDVRPRSTVDTAFLPPPEMAAVDATHVHRKNPLLGYAFAAAMPLVAVHVFRLMGPGPAAWALAITLAALAGFIGWRLWIRPVLAWNAGGVAIVGVLGRRRMAWPEVRQVTVESDMVVIVPHEGSGLALAAQLKRGGRTAISVREGLEYARARYAPSVQPPPFPSAAAAWPLVPLLAGVAVFLVWWASL
jgi:hypothetical protein